MRDTEDVVERGERLWDQDELRDVHIGLEEALLDLPEEWWKR